MPQGMGQECSKEGCQPYILSQAPVEPTSVGRENWGYHVEQPWAHGSSLLESLLTPNSAIGIPSLALIFRPARLDQPICRIKYTRL